MKKNIYSINFRGIVGYEFYFSTTSEEAEIIERKTPYLVDFEGWYDDKYGRNYVENRKGKYLFSFAEIKDKIKAHYMWNNHYKIEPIKF